MKAIFLISIFLSSEYIFASDILSVNGYLQQVQNKHDGLKSSSYLKKTAKQSTAEADLLYSPHLISDASYQDDQRPTNSAAFQGDKTKYFKSSVGIKKRSSVGLDGTVSYNTSKTEIEGASPSLLPQNEFYENHTKFELSQSLIKNGFGREIRLQEKIIKDNSLAQQHTEDFKSISIKAQAENIYYQLIIFKRVLNIQIEGLNRSKKIHEWNAKRVNKNLADRADLLQSKAALKSRELDVKVAKNLVRKYSRLFNSYRGIDSDYVQEKLDLEILQKTSDLVVPEKSDERSDIIAAKYAKEIKIAQAKLSRENLLPDLKISGSMSLYGRRNEFGETATDSFSGKNPVYAVGVSLSMPLDFFSAKKAKSALKNQAMAAELEYKRKKFEENNEWTDLTKLFSEQKERFELLSELESAQLDKLKNEKKLQRKGRSTTFKVLSFEQEYLLTQVQRLQAQGEVLSTFSQLKIFGK